jgi:hypothetical protein
VKKTSLSESIRIFISYAREDTPHAYIAYHKLKRAGFLPWLDRESIPAGGEWQLWIDRAVREANIFLVLLSPRSVAHSGYLQKEILLALEQWERKAPGMVYLIPARVEVCPTHARLAHLSWIDVFEETGWDRLIRQLTSMK